MTTDDRIDTAIARLRGQIAETASQPRRDTLLALLDLFEAVAGAYDLPEGHPDYWGDGRVCPDPDCGYEWGYDHAPGCRYEAAEQAVRAEAASPAPPVAGPPAPSARRP